ncbi:hypothetical protein GCK32_009136, partial [Trichostrongylus colubriformis]
VAEYYPDLLSNYSNSSGTISYETIITPRRQEHRELRQATEATVPKQHPYYLREVELLPPPLIPEVVEWDLVKRINKLLVSKEKSKKTVEVHRAEKGTMEQSKKVRSRIRSDFHSAGGISARGDLNTPGGTYEVESMGFRDHAGLDYKKRQQRYAAKKQSRPNFPKDPPAPQSRSYGPAAMSQDTLSDPPSSETS